MRSGHVTAAQARPVRRWIVAGGAAAALAAGVLLDLSASGQQAPGGAPATGQPQTSAPAAPEPQAGGRGARRGGGRGPSGTIVRGPNGEVWGYSDSAFNEGSRWRVHDPDRPQPPVVMPAGPVTMAPPADAIVLFDGKDLSAWVTRGRGTPPPAPAPAGWAVHDGYFESGPGGTISTRESFGDVQLHLEFATPENAEGTSQGRGNSGVIFMGRYEIQVLDSYDNRTYADGMAASIYGEYPPLVNAARKPGEWQSYDIVFEAPRFTGRPSPGYFTVFWNGVMVHNRQPLLGTTTAIMTPHAYTAHEPELPLALQAHGNRVKYRNIWIRRLHGYDQGTPNPVR
jgi:hypothetical protein